MLQTVCMWIPCEFQLLIVLCFRSWLEGELEVVVVKKQAKQSLETLVEDRKTISDQINKTKVRKFSSRHEHFFSVNTVKVIEYLNLLYGNYYLPHIGSSVW